VVHTFLPVMFKVMNQLLMLAGPWGREGIRKRCCSCQMHVQAHRHVGWMGGACMPKVPVASRAARGEAEPGGSSQPIHIGDAANSTHFSNRNSHLH